MRRITRLTILLTVLMLVYANPAEAQFWKKIFHKEDTKRKKQARKPAVKKADPIPVKKKQEINYPVSEKKTRYRVDVLMPLYLDELVKDGKTTFKGKLPEKAAWGIEFYEGLKLAVDSLNKSAYHIDIHIHDIASPANTPEKLLARKALDSTDLLMGLVQSAQVQSLASFAQKKQINFISALSPSDADVKSNPYFILMQPTLKTHCEYIMARVKKKYKNPPVILYRTSLGVAEQAYNYIIVNAGNDIEKILCNTLPTRQQLAPLFDSTQTNVIVMALMDNNYAEKALQQLYEWFPAYNFDVYGMPSWRTMASLKNPDAYPNVAVYITTPFYFDATTLWQQALSIAYKTNYGSTKPGELVYRGYETMYWLAQLLKKHGAVFNEKLNDNSIMPFTKYKIVPQWDKDDNLLYLENTHLYLLHYQSSSYMIEP